MCVWFVILLPWVSLTGPTSWCVRENRASGEHGGPGLKLDTVVGVDSFFPSFLFPGWFVVSHPPHSLTFCLFTFRRDSSLGSDMCFLSSTHPSCCVDFNHTWSEAVIHQLIFRKFQSVFGPLSRDIYVWAGISMNISCSVLKLL